MIFYPNKTIDDLYDFTNCEISIFRNSCIMTYKKMEFLSVLEILKRSTNYTVQIFKKKLEIDLYQLQEPWHFISLEQILLQKIITRY